MSILSFLSVQRGTFLFTIIPYSSNMALAVNIKNQKEIRNNPFARSYFQTASWFFIVLVVFCGGVYPSLSIVSSRLFAFEFLNSGLTNMELTKLTKLRFYTTILMENIPQLGCSLLYTYYLGTPSTNTVVSLTMSVLQLLAAILNFLILRRPTDCYAITYDLEMTVKSSGGQSMRSSGLANYQNMDNLKTHTPTKSGSGRAGYEALATIKPENSVEPQSDGQTKDESEQTLYEATQTKLSKEAQHKIRKYRERKSALRGWLSSALSIPVNRLELGYCTLTPNGCLIRVIHYTFEDEMEQFNEQKFKFIPKMSSTLQQIELQQIKETEMIPSLSDPNHPLPIATPLSVSVPSESSSKSTSSQSRATPSAITTISGKKSRKKVFVAFARRFYENLYQRNERDVIRAFQNHFDFLDEQLTVKYWAEYKYSIWDMENRTNFSYETPQESPVKKSVDGTDEMSHHPEVVGDGQTPETENDSSGDEQDDEQDDDHDDDENEEDERTSPTPQVEMTHLQAPNLDTNASSVSIEMNLMPSTTMEKMYSRELSQSAQADVLVQSMNEMQLLTMRMQHMLKISHKSPDEVRKALLEEGFQAAVVDSLLQLATALALQNPMTTMMTTSTRKISGTTNTNEEYQYGSESSDDSGTPMILEPDPEAEEGIDERVSALEVAPMDQEGRPSFVAKLDMDLVSVCSSLVDPELRKSQDLGKDHDPEEMPKFESPKDVMEQELDDKAESAEVNDDDDQQNRDDIGDSDDGIDVVVEDNEQKLDEIDGDGRSNDIDHDDEVTDGDTDAGSSPPYVSNEVVVVHAETMKNSSHQHIVSDEEQNTQSAAAAADDDDEVKREEAIDDDEALAATEQTALCEKVDEAT